MEQLIHTAARIPWNKGKLGGQKDVCHGGLVAKRAIVIQQKTQRPVQFEITEQTRESLQAWLQRAGMHADD